MKEATNLTEKRETVIYYTTKEDLDQPIMTEEEVLSMLSMLVEEYHLTGNEDVAKNKKSTDTP